MVAKKDQKGRRSERKRNAEHSSIKMHVTENQMISRHCGNILSCEKQSKNLFFQHASTFQLEIAEK